MTVPGILRTESLNEVIVFQDHLEHGLDGARSGMLSIGSGVGVTAATEDRPHGLVDNRFRPIRDLRRARAAELSRLDTDPKRLDRLCELNVVQQVMNVGNTTVLQGAWERGQGVSIHGWIYSICNGLLKDLDVCVSSRSELRTLEDRENGRA